MNWNCDKLNEIQSIENLLSSNPSGSSPLFTSFIHATSEWIDKDYNGKKMNISPYKIELDKTVNLIAYYIECGYTTEVAMTMCGKNKHTIYEKFTDTHYMILRAARNQRTINKNKNK